jgi:hypothetical protein
MGKGLFTTAHVKAGDIIGRYEGEHLTDEQLDDRYGKGKRIVAPYTVTDSDGVHIDARNADLSNFTRYANDAGRYENNAAFAEDENGRMLMVATKDIMPGEAVHVQYGAGYWGNRRQAPSYEKQANKIDATKKLPAVITGAPLSTAKPYQHQPYRQPAMQAPPRPPAKITVREADLESDEEVPVLQDVPLQLQSGPQGIQAPRPYRPPATEEEDEEAPPMGFGLMPYGGAPPKRPRPQ